MNNYLIERKHIEELILTCFLNQHRSLELDQMEIRDTKLPFELFKANKTTKMIAKAIRNLQEENNPIDDSTVLLYIQRQTENLEDRFKINENEYLQVSCLLWMSFDSMMGYLNRLKNLDFEEKQSEVLAGLMR